MATRANKDLLALASQLAELLDEAREAGDSSHDIAVNLLIAAGKLAGAEPDDLTAAALLVTLFRGPVSEEGHGC